MDVNLDIYIEPGCTNCDQAYKVAELVRSQMPHVEVSLIDMSQPGVEVPQSVFAVPTYILNGETVSLGNPDSGRLMKRIKELVSA